MTKLNEKCADIALVMSDAYLFIKFRSFVEQQEINADAGDPMAISFMQRFDTMYRLCKHVIGEPNAKG